MHFVQLLPSREKCVLVVISMSSHWVRAFPCRQTAASSVAKFWGPPTLELDSDQRTHFTGQVVQQVSATRRVEQHRLF